ncbi:hypothetical protein CHARACLAT_001315 [Characodon lateralis]|uniref:Uncharacterized protein n=1 Tax=Characodon lateralis TaxID=208331 RepID=A0ABU7ERL2_9TELE|nr:hypothetical protein [Characodon lateralis]
MSQHVTWGRNHGIGEERKNFNDPESSPAGSEGWNVADTSLAILLQFSRLILVRLTPHHQAASPAYTPHPAHHLSNPLCLSLISFTGNINCFTHFLSLMPLCSQAVHYAFFILITK